MESTLGLVLSISDRGFYESAFRASLDTRMDAGRAIYQDDNAASRTLSDLRRALNRNRRWGLGIISAGGDAKDEDKRNLNRAMGWGSYKLNVDALKRALLTGNFWTPQKQQRDDMVIGYDWAQPLSIGVAMGAYSRENQEAIKQDILAGKKQSLAATGLNWLAYAGGAATGAMNSLVEQPLLTGLNQFARDVGYDNIPGAILKTAAEAPGTFIPSAARQWMQLTDNTARETRDSSPARQFINELKAQLPGQSQTLPPKYDIAGQPVERWAKDSNTLFRAIQQKL